MRRSNKPQNKWPSYYIERLTDSLENLSDALLKAYKKHIHL